jgi:hypothetical protein
VTVGDVRLFFDIDGEVLRTDGPRMHQVPTLLLLHGGPLIDHSMFKNCEASLSFRNLFGVEENMNVGDDKELIGYADSKESKLPP